MAIDAKVMHQEATEDVELQAATFSAVKDAVLRFIRYLGENGLKRSRHSLQQDANMGMDLTCRTCLCRQILTRG